MKGTTLYSLIAAVAGLAPAFFLVGPAVFADGGAGERLAIVGLMAVVYALLGALAGYLSGAWQPGIWLAVPAVLIAAVLGEWGWVLTGVAATAVGASTGGAYCGARLKGRRRSHRRR
ncbi:MAG TPA: hypothetical protein VD902_07110 [Symbiobacteriaceae bacterium]|nr:hypothetical protein [Symbiobacteriaceae bacterium]